jgi:sec-independent protein translocase protein TatA
MSPLYGFLWGPPGMMEMVIVGLIVLLLFGNRLPSVMRSLGKGITEFKKGVQGVEDDVEKAASGKIEDSSKQQEEPVAKSD